MRTSEPPVSPTVGLRPSRVVVAAPTMRVALLLAFGATTGIWLFTGYYFTKRLGHVEARAAIIDARYVRAQELLATARGQILLGSVYVRDALLEADADRAADHREEVETTYRAASVALKAYVPVLDSDEERRRVQRLGREVRDFRNDMLDVLATDSRRWPADARSLLRDRVMPRRNVIVKVSEEIQALNRAAYVRHQAQTAATYARTQRWVWRTLGMALAASLGIALLAMLYAGRLEQRVCLQRERESQNARDLQRLSARLLAVQEEERRCIARELHDEVGQVLTVLKLELAMAQRNLAASGGVADQLNDARAAADGALQTVRDLSRLLHPALLDDLGLPAAIECYLKGFLSRYGIRAELRQDDMDERLRPAIEAAAYRIVQEALTNVIKHADASTCRVGLRRTAGGLHLEVEDDGVGFDPTCVVTGRRGLGLIGIRERVAQLGGEFRVESAPGRGTRLLVGLPAAPAGDLAASSVPCVAGGLALEPGA